MNRKQEVIKGGLLEIILFPTYPILKTSIINLTHSKEKIEQLETNSKHILKEIQKEEIDELINNLSNRELNGLEFLYLIDIIDKLLDKKYIILNQGEKYCLTSTNTNSLKKFSNKIKNEQMDEIVLEIPIDKNIINLVNCYDGDEEINDFEIYFNDDYDISFDCYEHYNFKRLFNVLSEDIDIYRPDIIILFITFPRSIMSRLVEEFRMAHMLDWELYGKLSDLSKIKLILPECERIFKKVQLVVNVNKIPVLTELYNLIMKANREDLSYNTLSLRNKYLHGDYDGAIVGKCLIDRCMIEFLFTCLCFISFKNNVDII